MANMNELSLKTLTPENNFASVAELCLSLHMCSLSFDLRIVKNTVHISGV